MVENSAMVHIVGLISLLELMAPVYRDIFSIEQVWEVMRKSPESKLGLNTGGIRARKRERGNRKRKANQC